MQMMFGKGVYRFSSRNTRGQTADALVRPLIAIRCSINEGDASYPSIQRQQTFEFTN